MLQLLMPLDQERWTKASPPAERLLWVTVISYLALAALIAWLVPLHHGSHAVTWRRLAIGGQLIGPIAIFLGLHALLRRIMGGSNFARTPTDQTGTPGLSGLHDTDPRWLEGQSGARASFTYVDQHGEVTDRRVANWVSAGEYIEAHCLTRRQHRTFRKDRIEGWLER